MADKPKAPDAATLPGGAAFDVDNATPEDFDKHAELLRRRALVAGYAPAATAVETTAAAAPEVTKLRRDNGNPISMPQKAWDLLPADDQAQFEDAPVHVEKPTETTK